MCDSDWGNANYVDDVKTITLAVFVNINAVALQDGHLSWFITQILNTIFDFDFEIASKLTYKDYRYMFIYSDQLAIETQHFPVDYILTWNYCSLSVNLASKMENVSNESGNIINQCNVKPDSCYYCVEET